MGWRGGAHLLAARQQLALGDIHAASDPGCGEADAAQAWGEAYFSDREFPLARRAFERALDVRRRIEHPGVAETQEWLTRV